MSGIQENFFDQIYRKVSPLIKVFSENVKKLSTVSISTDKVLEIISNNSTCLEQISILIKKEFEWSKVTEDIFLSIEIFLSNLYRWISQLSLNRIETLEKK